MFFLWSRQNTTHTRACGLRDGKQSPPKDIRNIPELPNGWPAFRGNIFVRGRKMERDEIESWERMKAELGMG